MYCITTDDHITTEEPLHGHIEHNDQSRPSTTLEILVVEHDNTNSTSPTSVFLHIDTPNVLRIDRDKSHPDHLISSAVKVQGIRVPCCAQTSNHCCK